MSAVEKMSDPQTVQVGNTLSCLMVADEQGLGHLGSRDVTQGGRYETRRDERIKCHLIGIRPTPLKFVATLDSFQSLLGLIKPGPQRFIKARLRQVVAVIIFTHLATD